MKILLSPAKRMNKKESMSSLPVTNPSFLQKTALLADLLKNLQPEEMKKALGISGATLQQTLSVYAGFGTGLHLSLPALFAFNGTAFTALDASSFDSSDLLFAQEHLRLFSGLYGILRPSDLIEPYRLDVGDKLKTVSGNLYEFWRNDINRFLEHEGENELIFNLASDEYSRLIDKEKFGSAWLTLSFKEYRNGKYQSVSPAVKKARGLMARYIIQNKITDKEDVKNFIQDDYLFSPEHSSDNEWVFIK